MNLFIFEAIIAHTRTKYIKINSAVVIEKIENCMWFGTKEGKQTNGCEMKSLYK